MATMTQCAQCGQTDDHPKAHIGDAFGTGNIVTRHLDCLPINEVEGLRNDPNFGALNGLAIDAAVAGTHGDDLRALIAAQQDQRAAIVAATEAPAGPADNADAPTPEGTADTAPDVSADAAPAQTTEKG